MRVDKFLWSVRIFKTRTLAAGACKAGKVTVDGQALKPAREVEAGQQIIVRKGAVRHSYQIIDLPTSRVGAKLVDSYIEDITPDEETNKIQFSKQGDIWRRKKGTGRPTKKERRTIDRYKNE